MCICGECMKLMAHIAAVWYFFCTKTKPHECDINWRYNLP